MTMAVRPLSSLSRALLDQHLGVSVYVGRRLVEEQDTRIGDQGSGEADELALSNTEVSTALLEGSVVAMLQFFDEVVGTNGCGRLDHLVIGRIHAVVLDVLANGPGEQIWLLRDDRDLFGEGFECHVSYVDAVEGDATLRLPRRSASVETG